MKTKLIAAVVAILIIVITISMFTLFKINRSKVVETKTTELTSKKTNLSSYEDLPKEAVKFISPRGILVVSGGLTSSGRRIIIDLDSKKIKVYEGTNSYEDDSDKVKSLSDDQLSQVVGSVNKIWESDKTYVDVNSITADFNVVFILSDYKNGKKYYKMVDPHGPPQGELEELYDYLWSLVK